MTDPVACADCGAELGCVDCALASAMLRLKRLERTKQELEAELEARTNERDDSVHKLNCLRTDCDEWLTELRAASQEVISARMATKLQRVFGLDASFRAWAARHFG